MPSKAIITFHTKEISKMFKITSKYMSMYANSIGAEFISIGETDADLSKYKHPKYSIMHVSNIEGFDRYLLLDADIFIRRGCPSIFDVFPNNEFTYMFDESKIRKPGWKTHYEKILLNHIERSKSGLPKINFYPSQYNGGVTLFPEKWRKKLFMMPPWDVTKFTYGPRQSIKQQPWRNYCISKEKIPVKDLGLIWNRLPNKIIPKNKFNFLHLTGFPGWDKGEVFKLKYLLSEFGEFIDYEDIHYIKKILSESSIIEESPIRSNVLGIPTIINKSLKRTKIIKRKIRKNV